MRTQTIIAHRGQARLVEMVDTWEAKGAPREVTVRYLVWKGFGRGRWEVMESKEQAEARFEEIVRQ